MRILKILQVAIVLSLLIVSCKKEHYDVSNVHGISADGEVLLPVASVSFTVRDLMERFNIQNDIEWSESGDMAYSFNVDYNAVVNGETMLRFKDVDFEENYVFENQYQDTPPPYRDTMVSLERSIVFESENIHVMRAQMKSGQLNFTVESNVGRVLRVVLRSENIKDDDGNDLELDLAVHNNSFGFNLDGLHYVSNAANTLNLSYDLYVHVYSTTDPELFVKLSIEGHDLAFREMQGYVDAYSSHGSIDSVFSLFPDNMSGALNVKGVRVSVSERNTFSLGASLVVDTALVYSEGLPPYSILEPLPVIVDLPPQLEFHKVFEKTMNGQINAMGGRAYATSEFIVNPDGFPDMVTVVDTNRIDTRVSVEIPFSFSADGITYTDTVNMDLAHFELPDLIERLTLELTFSSSLPFNLNGSFYIYDSENERITDTLLVNGALIGASFDGEPVVTDVTLVINEARVENVLRSDRIILSFRLDSEAHDVALNADQKLDLSLKARAKYHGVVDFNAE